MNAPLYTMQILRLAASLREPVPLDRVDVEAELRSPTCGSLIRVAVQLDGKGRVESLAQEVQACAFGQAAAALMEQHAIGRDRGEAVAALASLTRWLDGQQDAPGDWPGLAALAPARSRKARHGAILLPFRALATAMEQVR